MIKNIADFRRSTEKKEVIVSYDCTSDHKPFGEDLFKFLRDVYESKEITLSNYKIGKKLNLEEIERLKNEIRRLFNTAVPLTEGKRDKKTIVTIITPNGSDFERDEIINEEI